MFWQIPSWLGYLSLWTVLTLGAYVLSFALFESLILLGLIVLLSLVFPKKMIGDKFVAQGSLWAITISLGAYLIQRRIGLIYKLAFEQLIVYSLALVGGMLVLLVIYAILLDRLGFLSRWVEVFAERMTVFAYIYIPLGVLSLALVILRNLF